MKRRKWKARKRGSKENEGRKRQKTERIERREKTEKEVIKERREKENVLSRRKWEGREQAAEKTRSKKKIENGKATKA